MQKTFYFCARRDGRVVDCGGLENRWTARFRGFESLSLRWKKTYKKLSLNLVGFFCAQKVAPKMHRPRFYALLRAFFKLIYLNTLDLWIFRLVKLEFLCFATGIVFFILNVAIAGYYQSVDQESKRYCSGISRLKVLHNNRTSWTSFSSYSYPRWNCTCASGFMQDTSIFPIFPLPEKVSLGKMYRTVAW